MSLSVEPSSALIGGPLLYYCSIVWIYYPIYDDTQQIMTHPSGAIEKELYIHILSVDRNLFMWAEWEIDSYNCCHYRVILVSIALNRGEMSYVLLNYHAIGNIYQPA